MVNDFTPFYELWTTTDVWEKSMHSWLNDDFTTIDPTFLEETVDTSVRTLSKNIKVFRQKDLTKIHKIAETMKEKVADFNPNVPMTMAMLTEGMKDRHWEAISTAVGHNIKPYEGFTLKNILDMNLLKHSEKIVDIGDRASKEYNIECSLKKMKKDWEDVFFSTKPYKKSGTSTVMGFDDAQAF
jgi:dynein heavy chain